MATNRRQLLTRGWQFGILLVGGAGLWTTWDLLRPTAASGFGGTIRSISPDDVPDEGVVEVAVARTWLMRINGEVQALSWKCTHLGCRVPFCDSSGQFECPCHGSIFNRAGDYRAGPAPRGLDSHPIEIRDDGLIYIDTGTVEEGPPPGPERIDEPVSGPTCIGEAGG